MATQPSPQFVESFYLENRSERPIKLVVEHQPLIFMLPPGEEFNVTLSGSQKGTFGFAVYNSNVTLEPWPRSVVSILHKGVELAGPYDTGQN